VEATEVQKFCKSCGQNLEIVNNALGRGDDTLAQLKVDMEGLKASLVKGGREFSEAVRREAQKYARHNLRHGRRSSHHGPNLRWEGVGQADTNKINQATGNYEVDPEVYLPRPKEWLRYSRQHNLRDGLISLLGGASAGFVLYYLGQVVIHSGVLESLDSRYGVRGVDQVVSMVWLIALIPVLKGFGQILYAAFFAESIRNIARSYVPERLPAQTAKEPAVLTSEPAEVTEPNRSAPASVTERTTNILDRSEPRMASESH